MAKRKRVTQRMNEKLHRGIEMAHKFHIPDIEVSSQTWAHKIQIDVTFALY